jgi:hypothetical protein
VPSLLRGGGVIPTNATLMAGACRFSTASPLPRWNIPSRGAWDHEAYEDSLTFTRPVFPLAHHSRMERERLRLLPWASHPTVTHDARQGGDGPADTGPDHTLINRASNRCNHSLRATFTSHGRDPSAWTTRHTTQFEDLAVAPSLWGTAPFVPEVVVGLLIACGRSLHLDGFRGVGAVVDGAASSSGGLDAATACQVADAVARAGGYLVVGDAR